MTKRYVVIAIRDLLFIISWGGSYFVDSTDSLEDAIALAKEEEESRGGKYGCLIYDTHISGRNEIDYKTIEE